MSAWKSSSFIQDSRKLPVDPQDLDFFKTVPSLQQWLGNPHYSVVGTSARIPRDDGENDLFAITLKTTSTIPKWLLVVRDEAVDPRPDRRDEPPNGSADKPDIILLVNLEQGTNGFKAVAHGGLLSALLDETLSYCVEFARQRRYEAREHLFTANLNIDFRQPVVTPGVAVIKSWVTKVEGRKYWLSGQIEGVEGHVCVQVKGLWISARPGKI
ncbi:uncharacterized protein HMPREF1541_09338 [Cyphellophora europaea CBS 101466]|uniref:Thioesterase domain-containing protein n=1 Tax=Cyphellophora europaea (strain CBS 101466) TaxID=1220924 RepID=W2S9V6_CYPE1|nr:uncharacterized protein HMPREF1541_09338 [Cyphellophora europaea CBS 101466]ETN45506.1 hypothetical protein HMPREF1541_09338 [Cyphellophora europaea CBS 101466]